MKKLVFTLLVVSSLMACSKSPESAAKEVCECYKSLGDTKVKELASKTKDCTQMASDYGKKFKDEDLKKFTTSIADCATGGLFK